MTIAVAIFIFTKYKKENKIPENVEIVTDSTILNMDKNIRTAFDSVSKEYIASGKVNFETYFDIDKINSYATNGKIYISNIRDENFGVVKIYDKNDKELSFFPIEDFSEISWTSFSFKENEKYILKEIKNEKTYFFEITIKKDGKYSLNFLCYTDGLTSQIEYDEKYISEYVEPEIEVLN